MHKSITIAPPQSFGALLSDRRAADFLDISRSTFHQLVSTKAIPKGLLIPGTSCRRWRRETLEELAQQWAEQSER